MLEKATKELRLRLTLWWICSEPVSDEHLYRVSEEVARAVGVDPFKTIRVADVPLLNAVVAGLRGRTLVLTRALTSLLTEEELKMVLLHEYAHRKLKHKLKLVAVFVALLTLFATASAYVSLHLWVQVW